MFMPARNTVRYYLAESFYHVYNRGINKELVFRDEADYRVFLNMLKRYLSIEPEIHPKNGPYPTYFGKVELLAFCLMPNHFHLLLYQTEEDAICNLLKSLCTSYGMYFNTKYERVGPVFQGRFRASHIQQDAYLQHISRYIHLNPKNYKRWPYSSLPYYEGKYQSDWVNPMRVLEMFDSDRKKYALFVSDYESQKEILDDLKYELADF